MSEYSHKMEMVDISCSPDPGLSPAIEKIVMVIIMHSNFFAI